MPASPTTVITRQRRSRRVVSKASTSVRSSGVAVDDARGRRAIDRRRGLDERVQPKGDRVRMSSARGCTQRRDFDSVPDQAQSRGAEQDLARGRELLEPASGGHRCAGDRQLRGGRLVREDLSGLDSDVECGRSLAHRGVGFAELDGGAKCAARVVLVNERHAEDGHHAAARDPAHGSAVTFGDGGHLSGETVVQRVERLRVGRLGGGPPAVLAEACRDDRHDLPPGLDAEGPGRRG
jgi:hypothetical protein